ncbi:kinase-like domain-containing protein [Armillaria borealis]|uniref:Kinase-like domain-containing protein n=1 Tax=Armillaria borealis TaxID=47425 RepID=A0AA39JUR0_9AGAR|nr:kinase-like domain-containing protein [Armillaria borealis]
MAARPPNVIRNWWLGENLGSGYSGSIWRAQNIHNGEVVALKVQDVDHECPTNRYERAFYPSLQGGKGMPTLWAAGVEGKWDYLAIDLLGSSLDSLYRKSGKEMMDLRSTCCIAMQVIARLEFMHSRGILHRDIQLANCTIGLPPNETTIYMIDFGFSKRYIDPRTHRHIPEGKGKRDFIGNYWFSSVGVHCRGKVPSRRDDMEAAALMFIHLLTPRGLPWTRNGVPKTDDAHERLKKMKRTARPEDLCQGMPSEFEEFLRYCRRLNFMDCPDYGRWINEFRELAMSQGFPPSDDFIWPPPTPRVVRAPRRSAAPAPDEMEHILNGLGNLNLGDRVVLGDRRNIDNAIQKARQEAHKPEPDHCIVISSDSEDDAANLATPKAQKLNKLTKRASAASDNATLSDIVFEFSRLLKSYTSRSLTKEGFAFLDALYKQLEDPSVFDVTPLRTSRSRSQNVHQNREPMLAKLGIVAKLRREVGAVYSNKQLATMVEDFGRVTNRSNGRTVTKDGFAFLEGVAEQLRVIR